MPWGTAGPVSSSREAKSSRQPADRLHFHEVLQPEQPAFAAVARLLAAADQSDGSGGFQNSRRTNALTARFDANFDVVAQSAQTFGDVGLADPREPPAQNLRELGLGDANERGYGGLGQPHFGDAALERGGELGLDQ